VLLFLADGTLLAGLGDGTVTALDGSGHRRYSLGFRGAISGLVAAGEGLVAVTTERGVMALMTGEGRLRWERQITAEHLGPAVVTRDHTILAASQRGVFALSSGGEPVFSHASPLLLQSCGSYYNPDCHQGEPAALSLDGDEVVAGYGLRFRLDGPHPAVPSLVPSFPLTFRQVLDGTIVSLLAEGSSGVAALFTRRKSRSEYEWDTDDKYEVVRIEGGRRTRLPVPEKASKNEVFIEGTKPAQAPLFIDALVAGPDGNPWVLARRFSGELTTTGDSLLGRWAGAGQIFEVRGDAVEERNDLFKPFSEHWLSTRIATAPGQTANLLCFGYEKSACAVHDGATFRLLSPPFIVTSVSRVGEKYWLLSDKGELFRTDAKTFASFDAVPQPAETPFAVVAGASEQDAWADSGQRYGILHFDGTRWSEVPVPIAGGRIFVRAADDVWSGRMRWDGKQWSLVHGAPAAAAVLAKSKDDVWIGNAGGLWHGTAPGPSPVRLPALAPSDDGAVAAPAPLPLGAAETRYTAQRVSIEVAGGVPLTAANNVSAAPDGVLWLQAWNRVIEVDGSGKGTTLRNVGRGSFGRWAHPEAKGRGAVLDPGEVRRIDGSAATPEEVQLDGQVVTAVHGDPRGALWVLGAPPGETAYERNVGTASAAEFSPHALVRAGNEGFRPVLGLPSAAWCDVAATSDGGAWFAGALGDGPSGEGILFHARGRLGSEATSRFRAAASLLAVSAVAPDEVWAVGAAGTVIHVKGSTVTRHTIASGEWLRAVFSTGPDDVWIGGDGGTLLHYDGRALQPVDNPLGAHAAFTGIAASGGTLWAVGPSGILRITRRP
jgi:hypothetical protein